MNMLAVRVAFRKGREEMPIARARLVVEIIAERWTCL
jgi:hypothetical protein